MVIHGWNKDGKSLVEDNTIESLAKTAAIKYPEHQVLVLDWKQAADHEGDWGVVPNKTAGAIAPVADWAKNALDKLGLAAKQISLFGHSLGTYVSAEIGRLFNKVNSIVALDPAASGPNSGGDKFDINGNTSEQEKVIDFRNVAEKSVAFVASDERGGLADDNNRAATASDSFIVRFEDDRRFAVTDTEYHGGVVEVFTDLLFNNNLSLSNYQQNWFGNRGGQYNQPIAWSHEGVISANKVGRTWKAKTLTRVPGSDKATWV